MPFRSGPARSLASAGVLMVGEGAQIGGGIFLIVGFALGLVGVNFPSRPAAAPPSPPAEVAHDPACSCAPEIAEALRLSRELGWWQALVALLAGLLALALLALSLAVALCGSSCCRRAAGGGQDERPVPAGRPPAARRQVGTALALSPPRPHASLLAELAAAEVRR